MTLNDHYALKYVSGSPSKSNGLTFWQMTESPPNFHMMVPRFKPASRVCSMSRSAFHQLGIVALAGW